MLKGLRGGGVQSCDGSKPLDSEPRTQPPSGVTTDLLLLAVKGLESKTETNQHCSLTQHPRMGGFWSVVNLQLRGQGQGQSHTPTGLGSHPTKATGRRGPSFVPPPNTETLCPITQAGFGWESLMTELSWVCTATKAPKTKHPERGPAQGSPGLSLAPWEGKLLNREECKSQS